MSRDRFLKESDISDLPGGGSGASSFSELDGQPRDNAPLAVELQTHDNEITELQNGVSSIQTDNITVAIYKISNFATP